MKKILSLLIIALVLIVTGCGDTGNNNTSNGKANESTDVEVKVDDLIVKLNFTGSFNALTFKYPSEAQTMNVGTYYMMDYLNNGDFIVRVAMYRFENKPLEKAMEGSSATYRGTETINGIQWHVYDGKTQNGEKMVNYAYRYNSDTYTITFIFNKDLNNFMEVFMKELKFS